MVSDLRHDIAGGVVSATLSWPGGSDDWHWTGDIGSDTCVRVGTLQTVAPDADGPLVLDLKFDAGVGVTLESAQSARNRYASEVRR